VPKWVSYHILCSARILKSLQIPVYVMHKRFFYDLIILSAFNFENFWKENVFPKKISFCSRIMLSVCDDIRKTRH
jgi:hypothetical protein